jgi:murein DD-endopeptidase MepM/ murein hydrolase activator NlpD
MSQSGLVGNNATTIALAASSVVQVRRSTLILLLLVLLALATWTGASVWYVLRKDDLASRLISRETVRQYAYEDRIASLRSEIDRLSSRALLDQDSVEARVSELITRQTQLETRHAVVATLAESLQTLAAPTGSSRAASMRGGPTTKPSTETAPSTDVSVTGTASSRSLKPVPSPEQLPLRGVERRQVSWHAPDEPETREQKIGGAISHLAGAIDRTQGRQANVVGKLQTVLAEASARYKAVVLEASLDPDRLAPMPGLPRNQGGPYIPINVDPKAGAFEEAVFKLQPKINEFARLKGIVDALPLSRPMPPADGDMTSNFGYRIDPFTRAPAVHSGIDFRAEHGAAIKAAGAGRVITAEYANGYGNMVEIDHGNDITTRYGHMSAILVSEGQTVQVGTILGRVGSTGRSTGPHLHYETRIGSEAIDPLRFIRAGQKFQR